MARRPWKLELGDFRDEIKDLAAAQKPAAKPRRGGGARKDEKQQIWTPAANAKTVGHEDGHRLGAYLARLMGGRISVRAARALIEQGQCRVNGRVETFASYQVQRGDIVECQAPEEREHTFDKRRVLFEDEAMLAYDKPAWLAVTRPDAKKGWSLIDILKLSVPGLLVPVHRLDADTSGIVIVAKTEKSARALEDAFRDHLVKKSYRALVRGHPREKGEHRSYLIKVASGKGFERWKSGQGAGGREAITAWEVEERLSTFASLVKIEPKTGRYHQIRIHFSEMGHPLYGDNLYGDRLDPVQMPRHMLHSFRVRLAHPITAEPLVINAPIPADFKDAMARLRKG